MSFVHASVAQDGLDPERLFIHRHVTERTVAHRHVAIRREFGGRAAIGQLQGRVPRVKADGRAGRRIGHDEQPLQHHVHQPDRVEALPERLIGHIGEGGLHLYHLLLHHP